MIDLGLGGKRAVVVGAGHIPERAGHGYLSSLQLARAGATVACIDIDEERAQGVAAEIEAEGGSAIAIVADATDQEQLKKAFDEVVERIGGVDICVDIIGFSTWESVTETSLEDWDWAIRQNLTQVFQVFQEASRQMIDQGTGGSLVALASVDGTVAAAFHAPYGAAKAGVISLAKTFAHELGKHGIRANTVAPGNVGSGNMDQPEGEWAVNGINPLAAPRSIDIANAVLFLSSGLAARITGQTLIVDGGATIKEMWGITEEMLPVLRVGLP